MDITSKTKDNLKAQRDITHVCNHPSFELDERGGKPRAPFCLKVKDRKEVMRWMKSLKRCVNAKVENIHGLKSHDYHIIMERLLPVILRGYLDDDI
jgi:hypothetical protein